MMMMIIIIIIIIISHSYYFYFYFYSYCNIIILVRTSELIGTVRNYVEENDGNSLYSRNSYNKLTLQ
jgi:hypothetical protein